MGWGVTVYIVAVFRITKNIKEGFKRAKYSMGTIRFVWGGHRWSHHREDSDGNTVKQDEDSLESPSLYCGNTQEERNENDFMCKLWLLSVEMVREDRCR